MSNNSLYKISYSAKPQQGVWHSHDDLEITWYGTPKAESKFVVAPSEGYARAWFAEISKYWPKEHDIKDLTVESLGSVTILNIS